MPEGASDGDGRPPSRRNFLTVLAGIAIAVGAVAIAALTAPAPDPITPPEAVPEASTTTTEPPAPRLVDVETFSVEELETGPQLNWERTAEFGDVHPRALVEHEGSLYLFGATTPPWDQSPDVVTAWRSEDGTEWEALGNIFGEGAQTIDVTSTSQGLVTVGMSGRGEELTVWQSEDGLSWTPSPISVETDSPYIVTYPQAVFADEDLAVVIAAQRFDFEVLLEDHLGETGQDVDISLSWGWDTDYTEDGRHITVYGPLGIPALSVPVEELGLTEEEIAMAERDFDGESAGAPVWAAAGGEWIRSSIPGAQWIDSIVETHRGDLLAIGFDQMGQQTWRSVDGLTWVEHESDRSPSRVRNWGERMVAASDNWAEVLVSGDAVTWEEAGLRHLFPAPIDWYVSDLTAGQRGIAVSIEGWSQTGRVDPQRPDPPTITRDGVTLTMNFDAGRFEVGTGTETLTWQMYGQPNAEERPEVDLAEKTVTFVHPETGESLVALTFEELERAEQEYWIGTSSGQRIGAIALSPDGDQWAIQAIAGEFGEEARIVELELADEQLLALVVAGDDYFSPNPPPGFAVWTAPLP